MARSGHGRLELPNDPNDTNDTNTATLLSKAVQYSCHSRHSGHSAVQLSVARYREISDQKKEGQDLALAL